MLQGFRDFLLRGNVVDLAVAVVVGSAFNAIVQALVKDIITPLIGTLGGKPDFSTLKVSLNGSQFLLGDFLNAIISFLIIAAVIYFLVVLPMNKLQARLKRGESVTPTTKPCPDCLQQVPLQAKKCMYCTSVLAS